MLAVNGPARLLRPRPHPARRVARGGGRRGGGAARPQRRRQVDDDEGDHGPGAAGAGRGELRRPAHRAPAALPHRPAGPGLRAGGAAHLHRAHGAWRTSRSAARPPRDGAPAWTEDKLFALFPNLAGMRERPGGRMSGGEQQMLTIARTLMGNPRCVLLDEPSEGLAPIIVEQMAQLDPRAQGRGAVRPAVRAEPAFLPRPSPTAPTSSRRARSASADRWPSSPPTLPSANSISRSDHVASQQSIAHRRHRCRRHLHRPVWRSIRAPARCKLAKVPTTVDNQAIGFMAALAAAGADPATAAGHRPRHDHDDQRAARTQDRQGRADHHQGLPRRARARPPHAAAALRPARHLPSADRARVPARSAGAHGRRRQGADAARRGRRGRGGEEAAGAGLRGRRHPFPAQLHQSRARDAAPPRSCARCGRTATSRRATPSCRSTASTSAA